MNDSRRPTDEKKYGDNWDKIFSKKKRTFADFISRAEREESVNSQAEKQV